jgi:DNA-binding NtrC family response regulator
MVIKYNVLLIDDQESQLEGMKKIIEDSPSLMKFIDTIEVKLVDPEEGAQKVAEEIAKQSPKWNIIIADLYMPDPQKGGFLIADELTFFKEIDPQFPVRLIFVSNKQEAGGRVREYLCKDWIIWRPKPMINDCDYIRDDLYPPALWVDVIAKEIQRLNETAIKDDLGIEPLEIIGSSAKILVAKEYADLAASDNKTVLLIGESGTGKELFAKYIHKKSVFAEQPFEAINCAAIPENLLESELFGYSEGTFTDAKWPKTGIFEKAKNGIVFLDEIQELPPKLQSKLLRVLDPDIREFTVMGPKSKKIKFEGKFICATTGDLADMVKKGSFEESIYRRITHHYTIKLPPLRERREDIISLSKYLIEKECKKNGWGIKQLSKEAEKLLEDYHWPGNVRELKCNIEIAVKLSNIAGRNEIRDIDFPKVPRTIMETSPAPLSHSGELEDLKILPPEEFVIRLPNFRHDEVRGAIEEQIIKNKIKIGTKKLLRNMTVKKLSKLMGFSHSQYFYQWLGSWDLNIREVRGTTIEQEE